MNDTVKFYIRLVIRRAPVMLLLLIVATAMGVVLATRLPTTYETSARLVVQPQQIAENLAASTVRIDPVQEVRLLQERLLTRATLLEIARSYDVFENMDNVLPGSIVDQMRAATDIRAGGGRGGQPVLLSVSFSARSPQIAAGVVNEYVTRITAENARLRTGAATETLDFFEQEVERLTTELQLRSAAISAFQRENADALPDDQPFRMQRLSLLQERMGAAERERSNLIETRNRLIQIFEATGRVMGTPEANQSPEQRQLTRLEGELATALTIYSETAPQVVTLTRRIETLRETVAQQGGADTATVEGPEALLNLQLTEIDTRIESLDTQIAEVEVEMDRLDDAIARTPQNAITLDGLQRDYDNISGQYDTAVERLAQASMGERIEVSARGQRISLIEAAPVPTGPSSPNRPLVAMSGFGIGLALAAGFFLVMEFLNRSIRRPAEIVSKLGITPLATLPYLETRRQRMTRRFARIAAVAFVVIAVPVGLWAIDTYYLPLDLLADRLIDRIGLT